MRDSRLVDKVLSAFPNMPLLAFGLWMAWTYIAFDSCSWISATDFHGIRMAQIYICATVPTAIVLLALFALAPRVRDAFCRPSFSVAGGAVSSLGALIIILIGPYVFGRYMDQTVSLGVFFASSALAGAGGAIVLAKSFDSFGQLLPRNGIIQLAFSELLAIAVFFVAAGVTVVPIGENGPGIFQSTLFVILPLLSGLLASLASRHNADLHKRSADRAELPVAFWRMTIVVGVLTLAESIVEAYANLALPLAATVEMFPIVLIFQGIAILLFIVFAIAYEATRMSFGRILNAVLVLTVLLVAVSSFAGAYNPLFYHMLPFVVRVFDFVYLCMLVFIMYQRGLSALSVFCASYGVFVACASVGWLVGTFLFPIINGNMALPAMSITLSLLTLAAAILLFSEKQFDILFESPGDGMTPLSELMTRKLHPDKVSSKTRGRFKIALDVVADEFGLSKREKDVLRHLAMGHDATRISEELSISWNTVRTHTRNVYSKLDVHSRQEVVDLVDSYKDR